VALTLPAIDAAAFAADVTAKLVDALPPPAELEGAIVKLTVEYPREYDALIDEPALRKHAAGAFEFHLVRRPQIAARVRLPGDQAVGSLSPIDLLHLYWRSRDIDPADETALQRLAGEIIAGPPGDQQP
jgi:exonuclease SbcD